MGYNGTKTVLGGIHLQQVLTQKQQEKALLLQDLIQLLQVLTQMQWETEQ